jgi:hypothetical protein
MTSHRRQRGVATPATPSEGYRSWPPVRRRHRELACWIAGGAAAVLVSAVAVALITMPAPSSASYGDTATATASRTGTLMGMLRLANASDDARGLLPPSSCRTVSTTMVACMAPAPGITGAVFTSYASPRALDAAYAQKVRSLGSARLRAGAGNCVLSSPAVASEAGWNHYFRHRRFPPMVAPVAGKAAGPRVADRVFCAVAGGGREVVVWTQDDGHLLGWVAGQPHEDVWSWWAAIRHGIDAPCNSTLVVPVPAATRP